MPLFAGSIRKGKGLERRGLKRLAVAASAVVFALVFFTAPHAYAEGPNAILTPAGYDANTIARGDDTSNLVVNLPFTLNWNGTSYTQVYINMNGNCTFGSGFTEYNPSSTIAALNRNIMAPFWADIDTRNTATGQVTYSSTVAGSVPQVNGRSAFLVNWINVAAYNNQSAPLNSFQLVIVDRSDTGAGNFDVIYNYDKVTWDLATSASTTRARAGWGRGATSFELPGSGTPQASTSTLIDSAPSATSLVQNQMNSQGQLGRYVWQVRGGAAPNAAPVVTVVDRVLEGNTGGGYTGYIGTGDATATDADGSIAGLIDDRPAFLPIGRTGVTWTATDNFGSVTTALQSIVVTDTIAPANPLLSSPTHVSGEWSETPLVTIDSSGASDICSGVRGFSYAWSATSTPVPDTVADPSIATTVTTVTTTTVDSQNFATATWPSAWTRSSTTYVRLTNSAGRARLSYAAEVWANNSTRRTANFYRDYDLSGFTSATLSFYDSVGGFGGGSDYGRVDYSIDGGMTFSPLLDVTATSAWTRRTFALPSGGTVRVRFSASVNRSSEYVDWDDIEVHGYSTQTNVSHSTHTTQALGDGAWYFGLRTVDLAGNWSQPVAYGPVRIDTVPPVTTDDVPSGWSRDPIAVTLSASDAWHVAATTYRIGSGVWTTYGGPFTVSNEGTTVVQYYSSDSAGHVEVTRNLTLLIDASPPSTPATLTASADSTSSVDLAWTPSSDTLSGLSHYEIVRDGEVIDTVDEPGYVDAGLAAGESYEYAIRAVDVAGNVSAATPLVTEVVPLHQLWLSVDVGSVTLAAVDPGSRVTHPHATQVSVGGVGDVGFELLCESEDFALAGPGVGVMPAEALAYRTSGAVARSERSFTNSAALVDSASGSRYRWVRDYVFDFFLDAPWDVEPGTYTTKVTYTLVRR